MTRYLLLTLTVLAAPAAAQTLPVTCNASGTICTQATPVTNPDGSLLSTLRGGSAIATGQVSVGTTSTLVVAARAARQSVTVAVGAANTCAFGNNPVTTTTGFPLQPVAGATITLPTSAALYAVCSATTTVSYVEAF